jgi:GH15 family glucan-1,4-alpha-glucosidase
MRHRSSFQLDIWGEMMDALHLARESGLAPSLAGRSLQCVALEHLEAIWKEPDDGIWEVRGGKAAFYALESHGVGRI